MSGDLSQFVTKDDRSPLRRALDASRGGVAVKVIEFDGCGARLRGIPLALRTLSAGENLRLRAEALRWLIEKCRFTESYLTKTTTGEGLVEFEAKLRTIAIALVEPAPPHQPVAKDAEELRETFDADEIVALFEMYLDWVKERSPITTADSAEEVASLCDALGKGTQPLQSLSGFDSSTLRSIIIELVSRERTRTSSLSSPTTPSPDTETSFSDDSD